MKPELNKRDDSIQKNAVGIVILAIIIVLCFFGLALAGKVLMFFT
jgi:hypothetical protein